MGVYDPNRRPVRGVVKRKVKPLSIADPRYWGYPHTAPLKSPLQVKTVKPVVRLKGPRRKSTYS